MHLVYHGLERGLRRAARRRRRRAPRPTARCACSASAGSCARRASTSWSRRARELHRRGVDVRGGDRRPGRRARRRGPRAHRARSASRTRSRCPARWARPSCATPTAAPTRSCLPAASSPTATATASPTCSSRRWPAGLPGRHAPPSPGSRSWSPTAQRPARRPTTTRRASPTRCCACARSPSSPSASAREGARTVRERFDGDVLAPRLVALFDGASGMTRRAAVAGSRAAPVFCIVEPHHRDLERAELVARGSLHPRRAHARPRPRARLDRRGAARRRRVADRVGEVLRGPRPRPRVPRDRRQRFLTAWERLVELVHRPGAGRPRLGRRRPRGACRTGSTPGTCSRRSPDFPGLRRGWRHRSSTSPPNAGYLAEHLRRSATTARSSSTRCCCRAGLRGDRRRRRPARLALAELHAQPARTCGRTGSTASARPTTT